MISSNSPPWTASWIADVALDPATGRGAQQRQGRAQVRNRLLAAVILGIDYAVKPRGGRGNDELELDPTSPGTAAHGLEQRRRRCGAVGDDEHPGGGRDRALHPGSSFCGNHHERIISRGPDLQAVPAYRSNRYFDGSIAARR
jgi:hypothetical protein